MKPFPTDVILILAAEAGKEVREHAPADEGLSANCRDCGAALIVSRRTTDAALGNPARGQRLIQYVCGACSREYDLNTVDELHDHRAGRDQVIEPRSSKPPTILGGYRREQIGNRTGMGWTYHSCALCGAETAIGPRQSSYLRKNVATIVCFDCTALHFAKGGSVLNVEHLGGC